MSRRTSLPGAAELFRSTGDGPQGPAAPTVAPLGRAQQLLAEAPQQRDQAREQDLRDRDPREQDLRDPLHGDPVRRDRDGRDGPTQRDPDPSLDRTTLAEVAHGPRATRASGRRRVAADAERRPTGRERHDEKITVYVSAEELMDLERARLALRGEHGLAVDRGRIVREALAVVLADLEAHGEASTLVRRLHGD
ncbi:MAG: hypothetical protein JWN08_1957 [Frankiales bacterium]|nr:hypothetical protein [Frankiales bacterium]